MLEIFDGLGHSDFWYVGIMTFIVLIALALGIIYG
jgi:hypothetical protein